MTVGHYGAGRPTAMGGGGVGRGRAEKELRGEVEKRGEEKGREES